MNTFTISCVPYYDRFSKCYMSVLAVDEMPSGPLARLVKRVEYPKLSPFQQDSNCYTYDKCKYLI